MAYSHCMGTRRIGKGNETGTIGNNGSWFPSPVLDQCEHFHMVLTFPRIGPSPVPMRCEYTIIANFLLSDFSAFLSFHLVFCIH